MPITKFLNILTACFACLWLASCTNQPDVQSTFNRTEAVKARINLALAYLEQNDFPKAKENIDKALNHDKKDYLPYSVLAYYYQQIGDVNKAKQNYQQALTLSQQHSPDNQPQPDVQNNYGTFLCKQGQFGEAYQQFQYALASQSPYYHQADTLENFILCANQERNLVLEQDNLRLLEKIDPDRAKQLKKIL